MMQEALVTVGQIVAERYEITKHLGTGGFAKVFKAFDRVIEREVAIKFLDLRTIHGSDQMIRTILERFRREAKLAAKIQHRNVVNIHDIGQLDDRGFRPFIVMELLNGYDLEDQLNEHGPFEPTRLLPLYVDCLDALGEAHEIGIVHKDLKPSNLFLSNPLERSEAIRIVDFGIAHIKGGGEGATEEDEGKEPGRGGRLTATGQILGTLQYLTPEYIAAQIVTPALDVYQMAMILVELLSGERVIKTDNPFECLRIHTFGLLELPEYLLDSSLGPVLRKGLAAEHEQRYQNAAEFADALSKVDPSTIPVSPLIGGVEGARVVTSQFQAGTSSPAIPTNDTSNFSKPSTGELSKDDGFLDTMAAPEELAGSLKKEIDLGREANRNQQRAMANDRPETAVTGFDDELEPDETKSKKGLAVIASVLAVGILAALGGVVYLVNNSEKKAQTPPEDTNTVATNTDELKETTPPVETTPPPPKETTPIIAETTPPAETTPVVENGGEDAKKPPEEDKVSKKYARSHKVRIRTEPRNVQIKHDGKDCSYPCSVTIKKGERTSGEIVVSADGYKTRTYTATRDEKSVTLKLESSGASKTLSNVLTNTKLEVDAETETKPAKFETKPTKFEAKPEVKEKNKVEEKPPEKEPEQKPGLDIMP
jgi:serine/threonine-protein kinase